MQDIGRNPTLPAEYELCQCPRCFHYVPFIEQCPDCEQWFGPNCYRLHDCQPVNEQEQQVQADPSS